MFKRLWSWLIGAHLIGTNSVKKDGPGGPNSKVDLSIGLTGVMDQHYAQRDARIGASHGKGTRTDWAMRGAQMAPAPDKDPHQ